MLRLREGRSYSGEGVSARASRGYDYIGPDGSRQIFEDHAGELLIDALVIDDRGAEPRTARLVVHDVDRLVTSLDRLLDDLSDTREPDLRPAATPAGLRWLLHRLRRRRVRDHAPGTASPYADGVPSP